ncbi:MAG: hypothetical protein WKF59_03705 [Chitinophagaceae bacterium]
MIRNSLLPTYYDMVGKLKGVDLVTASLLLLQHPAQEVLTEVVTFV